MSHALPRPARRPLPLLLVVLRQRLTLVLHGALYQLADTLMGGRLLLYERDPSTAALAREDANDY